MMSSKTVQDQPGLDVLVNFPISDAILAASADPEQAAKVLLLAARLMRDRQLLPYLGIPGDRDRSFRPIVTDGFWFIVNSDSG